ncbi:MULTISPECIES: oxidoreductase [Rhizobium/Agrobacterium group]|uniref:Oxidoreductase n=2 Tax=Rhizobium/Agrobacterium group TaxID=227290 RepID=B9K1E8_ALLAM|nr:MULTISPECIES: oxidoreductase [Rhizobium/Agrobacterium group]ACM38696.1 conserved hypothetical protein [Allorhizobium ampelinum S4]MCF1445864.1 oxidoreductase [Allorhizobium ampelinum]MCF1491144.1 oxidoreductase [Allorhizobium ampelinum]MUO26605.1 oxidoreductase [Agrobacterium vitis]MUO41718.1 oxidoreductase [Agrobacterium vitis]
MRFVRLWAYIVLSVAPVSMALAGTFAEPKGKPILVISGNIENRNTAEGAAFDLGMLEAIGSTVIKTANPWYEGRTAFEGVPLKKLMDFVGAKGTKVTAVALNDYVTTIPLDDFNRFNVLLAFKRDENYMPVRDKGPLFIVYPYDSDQQLQSQVYYMRSAWQVSKLIVE